MFGILALICIILGFVVGIFNVSIVFDPAQWFLAAIAFGVLNFHWLPQMGPWNDRSK